MYPDIAISAAPLVLTVLACLAAALAILAISLVRNTISLRASHTESAQPVALPNLPPGNQHGRRIPGQWKAFAQQNNCCIFS